MDHERSRTWPTQAAGIGFVLLIPAAVVCTLDFAWPALFATGSFDAAFELHDWGLILAPLALLPLVVGRRRHGKAIPLVLGIAGEAGLLVHTILHQSQVFPFPLLLWEIAGQAGTALLMAGLVLNAIDLLRWASRRRQAPEPTTLDA